MSEGSYFPDYFSIEDIMVTQEKVPCVTVVPFSLTGFSIEENDDKHIDENVTINVPLWLAKKLCSRQIKYLKVEVPEMFKQHNIDAYEADPRIIDLYRINPYFFEYGMIYSQIPHKFGTKIREILQKMGKERFKKILNWVMHEMKDPWKMQELDLSEQRILKNGLKGMDMLNEWLHQTQLKIKPSDVVTRLNRSKALDSI
ncbi:DNA replication complex GINS protein PSF1, putative [Pediculus humanus corporis]|uniref:DNA replication complex GINS protein PSF3 n=1 Tax=Pediculus humanus subsp. corporis TaxID=121224 RepID=E0VWC1_PEDHC|nr:DNA replication complex GINS protein PSF1, putative [Pediculus humanus corporis]EEB17677.1 DNA replication complex GINS protein PSF1, putative [Pediculus humanus corporis]